MTSKSSRDPSLLACSNKIMRFGSKAPMGVVNQRKNIFFSRFHTIGCRFMLLQPINLLFSKSTLKPSVYTLSALNETEVIKTGTNFVSKEILQQIYGNV